MTRGGLQARSAVIHRSSPPRGGLSRNTWIHPGAPGSHPWLPKFL